jgi:hypothetical protein
MDKIVNSVSDFIRGVFSTLVNKDDEIFKAFLASDDSEKPGTMEKIFNDIEETRDKWCNSPNVYEQEGEMMEKTLSFFSVLTRAYNESDASLKWRNWLLYVRNGDTIWGDRWDIIKLFRAYFDSEFVYIVNNTDDIANNLLSDGNFEENTGAWTLESCKHSHDACFSGRYGIFFNGNGKCYQTLNINADSVYYLHYFLKGNISVEVKDNNGRYWKPAAPYVDKFGAWVETPTKTTTHGKLEKWEPMSIFFIADNLVSAVTISFIGIDGDKSSIDYVRLFKKENCPTFTLIVAFSGRTMQDSMGLAPGTNDPIVARNYSGYKHFSDNGDPEEVANLPNDGYIEDTPLAPWEDDEHGINVDYSIMSYIEQSHIFGIDSKQLSNIHAELLEIVRAGGITSYIEVLIKDLDE